MTKERFLIRDLYEEIRGEKGRKGFIMKPDGENPMSFDTYPEANSYIPNLPNGIYQVEKIFIQIRDASDDSNDKL